MKNLDKSVPRSGNVSVVGGVHSFAVSYLKTVNGTVEAKDVDLPYFYICPLSEGALTVRCLNQNEDVVLPAALYEVIDREHPGTLVDPIPYTPPMEIFSGKYYKQNGVLYLCTRDSGQPLAHNLEDLVGTYVETVDEN